jgi:hypothetical protein
MTVRYSTNWMGPINKYWYEKRNLEPWTYSAGRIDCRGKDLGKYGDEIHLDPMLNEDWGKFSIWLSTIETDYMWSLKELVEKYEKTNPKIRWWEDER